VGAGSTITEDVPPGKLAIARGRQVIKERRQTAKEREAPRGADLVDRQNLPELLDSLGLSCSHTDIDEFLILFSRHGVRTVDFFRKLATPENIGLIKSMLRQENEEPCNCQVVVNLISLAESRRFLLESS
jgi:hypothetical protein